MLKTETNPDGFPDDEGVEIVLVPANSTTGNKKHHDRARSDKIHLVPFDAIRLGRTPRYLVKGVIPRTGLVVVWGPPKCGKSFWIFDLVMHVALGWPYRGLRVQQGPVVYCAFEGQSGFQARVEAFRRHYNENTAPFFLQPVTFDLVDAHGDLIEVISRQLSDSPPAVVVLDTLNRSMRGSESSDEDMTAYIKAADAIMTTFDCAVVIIHHCGVDSTRPRGHTSLTGAADVQIRVKRNSAKNIVVNVEYAKDGPEGEQIVSALETIELEADEDGEMITSCIVVPADGKTDKIHMLTEKQRTGLRALDDALNEGGEQKNGNDWPRSKVVPIEHWRALCDRHVLSKSEKPDSKKKAFQRVCSDLLRLEKISVREGYVWRCSASA